MNSIECESCIKRGTMYCPNSSECFATKDKPQWQNRIMLLEENTQLKQSLENAQNIYKNSHKYTSECEDKVIELKSVLKEIKECIMNFLLTEEYIIVDGKAIANNYHKLLEIIDKGIGEDK